MKVGLYFLAVATPAGWLALIVAGTVIVGTAATASVVANNVVKKDAEGIYDSIMNWINS